MTQKLKFILAIVVPIVVVAAAAIAVVLWDKKDPFPEAKVVREHHRKTADDPDIEYLSWERNEALQEDYAAAVKEFANPSGGPVIRVNVQMRVRNKTGGKEIEHASYFVQDGRIIAPSSDITKAAFQHSLKRAEHELREK